VAGGRRLERLLTLHQVVGLARSAPSAVTVSTRMLRMGDFPPKRRMPGFMSRTARGPSRRESQPYRFLSIFGPFFTRWTDGAVGVPDSV
jgi:hypothetical protein